jgi:hypothetical protein
MNFLAVSQQVPQLPPRQPLPPLPALPPPPRACANYASPPPPGPQDASGVTTATIVDWIRYLHDIEGHADEAESCAVGVYIEELKFARSRTEIHFCYPCFSNICLQ